MSIVILFSQGEKVVSQEVLCYPHSRSAIIASVMARPRRHSKPEHPLARWRQAHQITQQALADHTGLTQGMIAHIENYRHIPVRESLERLRTFTKLPTDALVRGEQFLLEQPDYCYRNPPNPPPHGTGGV
jgi:DNA-binding XRE family transcriptional regulator